HMIRCPAPGDSFPAFRSDLIRSAPCRPTLRSGRPTPLAAERQHQARMGYLLLATLAATGLVASLACHLMAWCHVVPPVGKWVFSLHVGIFFLWFPLVILSNRTMPKGARGNAEHLLAELPRWARVAAGGLFAYAFLNFAYFFLCTRQYPKHGV